MSDSIELQRRLSSLDSGHSSSGQCVLVKSSADILKERLQGLQTNESARDNTQLDDEHGSGKCGDEDEDICGEYNDDGDDDEHGSSGDCGGDEDEDICGEYNDDRDDDDADSGDESGDDDEDNHHVVDESLYCTEDFNNTRSTSSGTIFAAEVVREYKSCLHCNSTKEKVFKSRSDSAKAQQALRIDFREVSISYICCLELPLD
jgi:hypothetical protein